MIAVLNKSTRVTNADVATATRAVTHQVRYDAAPAWAKIPVGVVFYVHEDVVPPGAWRIVIFDNADQAGVLGWHSEGPDGLPFGRVFAGPVLDHGGSALHGALSVSAVLSHEVLEAYVDSAVNLTADDFAGGKWALECGDPVESDSYEVPVTLRDGSVVGVSVSDFVTPAWFDAQAPKTARFSHIGAATAPFTIAPGGYAIKNGNAIWGEHYPDWRRELKEAEFAAVDVARGRSARRIHEER